MLRTSLRTFLRTFTPEEATIYKQINKHLWAFLLSAYRQSSIVSPRSMTEKSVILQIKANPLTIEILTNKVDPVPLLEPGATEAVPEPVPVLAPDPDPDHYSLIPKQHPPGQPSGPLHISCTKLKMPQAQA